MQYTFKLGDTTLNRLGYGAMRITGAGVWGPPADHDTAIAVLKRAVELGVNFIDTADAYGPEVSENLIHEALYPYDGLVVATKGGMLRGGPGQWSPDGRPEHLREALAASLQRLGVDQIELYQFHRPDPRVPFEISVQALFDLQGQGKIKHLGLSNVTTQQLNQALSMGPITSVQNNYSVLNRDSEDVLRLCEENGIMFIPYFPIGGNSGGLREQALEDIAEKHRATPRQIGLAWLLQHSEVCVPIPGTSSVGHLEENMRAADVELTKDEIAQLDELGL
ncbi:MAG TPA: aldo/keto reductase [Candidatus Saccharimonadales bacterium]|nr:aldo/keto reductase [Candidatus Saccharimonadales bacterium]